MSDDELLRGEADEEDITAEGALRPRSLVDFIGQDRVRSQLGLVLEAARHRNSTADHVLLSGPPGLGKTTLAMIIAAAPSFTPLALPAVTVPSARAIGRSLARSSAFVSPRGCSSSRTSAVLPRPRSTVTGTISAPSRPFSCAAPARRCERSAKAS
jgi:hypothetical protein